MTVLAAAAVDVATAPVPVRARRRPARGDRRAERTARPGRPGLQVVPRHEHHWCLVQVDWTDGGCVKEFDCACGAVWFA